jgi:hypothetical protein
VYMFIRVSMWFLCMYVCVHMYMYVHVFQSPVHGGQNVIQAEGGLCVGAAFHFVRVCILVCIRMCAYTYAPIYVCVCVCLCVCMCVCVCVCARTYT